MALALEVTSLDGLSETVKAMYVETDGVFRLDVDGLPDVTGLKAALTSEREASKAAKKAATELAAKFAGFDPEEYQALKDQVEADADKKLSEDERVAKKVAELNAKKDAASQLEIDALKDQITSVEQAKERLKEASLDGKLRESFQDIVAKGSMKAALLEAKSLGFKLNDDGEVVQFKGDDIVIGKDGVTPYRPKEWITSEETKKESPYLYPGSSGGGDFQRSGGINNAAELMKLPAAERMTQARKLKK